MQRPRIGLKLFIICITVLIDSTNYITKYADDCSLLVPEKDDIGLSDNYKILNEQKTIKCRLILQKQRK